MSASKDTSTKPVKPTTNAVGYKKMIKTAADSLATYVIDYKASHSYNEHYENLIKIKAAEIKRFVDEMVAIAIKPEEPKKEAQEEKEEVKKKVKKEVKKEDNDNDNYDYDTVN